MSTLKKFVAGAALSVIFAAAHASSFAPVDGGYHDPSKPGSAVFLQDVGGGRVFGVVTNYTPDGLPKWESFVASRAESGEVVGELMRTRDGQCDGCAYTAPSYEATGKRVKIHAETPTKVKIDIAGVETVMVRQFPESANSINGLYEITLSKGGDIVAKASMDVFAAGGAGVFGVFCPWKGCDDNAVDLQGYLTRGVEAFGNIAHTATAVTWDSSKQEGMIRTFVAPGGVGETNEFEDGFQAELWRTGKDTISGTAVVLSEDGLSHEDYDIELRLLKSH